MERRTVLKAGLLGAAALACRPRFLRAAPAAADDSRLAQLEREHGGRLGVSILDLDSGLRLGHRADERFLLCSTFKLLAVGAVLARVDRGREWLDRRVAFGRQALLAYAPVTSQRVGAPGMSVAELCEAAITVSDNTAANLLLASLGGPAGVTGFVRGLGDQTTRLDRIEPELNKGAPGDERDTTTPAAMLESMRELLVGAALTPASRGLLAGWLRACSTGRDKLRAGTPEGWQVGDKTGSGFAGEANDVAIFWPPARKPILATAYYAAPDASPESRAGVLAAVGQVTRSIRR